MKNLNTKNSGPVIEKKSNNYSWVVIVLIVTGIVAYQWTNLGNFLNSSNEEESIISLINVEEDRGYETFKEVNASGKFISFTTVIDEELSHEKGYKKLYTSNIRIKKSGWIVDCEVTYLDGTTRLFEDMYLSDNALITK